MKKQIAVVTGGTRGLGRAIVEELIQNDYYVEFTYIASDRISAELEAEFKGCCRGSRVDCSIGIMVEEYISQLYSRHEDIKVLVNNVGITIDSLAKDTTWDNMEQLLSINLGSTVHFCKGFLPHMMRAKNGDIINISSLAAVNVRYGNGIYGAVKAALERYSQSMAMEAARFNVAVNMVAPGYVETDLIKDILADPKKRNEILLQIPLRRFTKPKEVAEAVSFLISRKPLLIGATLPVGGGAHL